MDDKKRMDRRGFLKTSAALSAGAGLAQSIEERNLFAHAAGNAAPDDAQPQEGLPRGKLGDCEVSRLIAGGNLISGHAHSRDLVYVSSLIRNYHTDEKICETLQLCEENGINTVQIRVDENTMRIIRKYLDEWGGNIQWMAQIIQIPRDIDWAIDNGAMALYYQGVQSDRAVEEDRLEDIDSALTRMKMHGVPSGVGAHKLPTIKACEETAMGADFYMKTMHPHDYWSSEHEEPRDFFSVFDPEPDELLEFIRTVEKPWIGFKVLAAGAIRPEDGFKYAFENGADFIDVGMFDFQVAQNARIARDVLNGGLQRERPWMA